MDIARLLTVLSALLASFSYSHAVDRNEKQAASERRLYDSLRHRAMAAWRERMAEIATNPPATKPNQDDLEALVAFYKSTGGPTWTNNSGWTDAMEGSPCGVTNWYGVDCDASGRVIGITLTRNNLVGPLPVELARATNLENIVLFSNALSGSIPPEIFQLPNLTQFLVDFNQFVGELPRVLVAPRLQSLLLYTNHFSGELPAVWKTPALEQLNVDGNEFVGNIPEGLGSADNLTSLVLAHNNLSGAFPASLASMKQLKQLWIFSTPNVSGPLPIAWSKLRLLTDVQIEGVTGAIPEWIGQYWTLVQVLVLSRGNATGSLPLSLCELPNLERLWLFDHQLTGEIPYCVNQMASLQWIDLSHNRLTGEIPQQFGYLKNMTHLALGDNQLTGSLPDSLGHLETLESLDVCVNMLTGGIPTSFSAFYPRMYSFTICYNTFSGPIPSELEQFLKRIDDYTCLMYGNPWSCPIPSYVPKSCGCTCSKCNSAENHADCRSCVNSSEGCGFCNNGPNCLQGNATSPYIITCPQGQWVFGTNGC
ncbi:uncharacterized protein [Oscarella lobularis]|uniref:uncharacterized protein n=1 Tax=Oscarella lobularis TaxID=121494 RepID=UPI0033135A73